VIAQTPDEMPATKPSTQPAATIAAVTTPYAPTDIASGSAPGWKPLAAGGAGLAIIVMAVLAVAYAVRKPPVYTFTLLDEASKASHRLQLMPGEKVDLSGNQPVKKSGAGKVAATGLNMDRKGRLTLSVVNGFAMKLNDRQIGVADKPMVKPGNVIEISANGQTKRLLVGPVALIKQGEKMSIKPVAASVRPA
jgi:hypothetical protein